MNTVIWTQTALDDLAAIKEYIARDSVYYADKFVDDAFDATDNLEIFPEMGRVVPERNDPSVREIIFGSYRIMYKVEENHCYITTVIHGRRLYIPEEIEIISND